MYPAKPFLLANRLIIISQALYTFTLKMDYPGPNKCGFRPQTVKLAIISDLYFLLMASNCLSVPRGQTKGTELFTIMPQKMEYGTKWIYSPRIVKNRPLVRAYFYMEITHT